MVNNHFSFQKIDYIKVMQPLLISGSFYNFFDSIAH